jgi:FkbM family methyltransferase
MGIRQFATSLSIIYRSEDANRPAALLRHLLWQARKLRKSRPITRRLSRSLITDDEPGGVISWVNLLGFYDFNNMSLVQLVLENGGALVDVGANIGSYTLIASENARAKVLSIEPNPTAFLKLQSNVRQNGRANVVAVNVAASASPGVLIMTNDGASAINRVISGDAVTGPTIQVAVDTLDAICAAQGVVPRLIKIDVEGHEPEVLEGASACLGKTLVCLVENGDASRVVDIMARHSMRGPFYYRHRRGSLSRRPQALTEDAIFIGPAFEAEFPQISVGECLQIETAPAPADSGRDGSGCLN